MDLSDTLHRKAATEDVYDESHRKVKEILNTIKIPKTDAFKYYMEALNKLGFT